MTHVLRTRSRATLAVATIVAAVGLAVAMSQSADAHGSAQSPPSRTYTCRFEDRTNPRCAEAWEANAQALYDWMEVNIGDAAGRHRELIPDGELCSAGRDKYAAFDVPGDWPVTALTPGGDGRFELVYQNTAPHSTAYYRVYLTGEGFDARTDRLAWDDLDLVYDSGSLGRQAEVRLRTELPDRDVPAILYIVWQRDDSPEAFYSCSDVTISSGAAPPVPPPTVPPTTERPTTLPSTVPPTTAPSTTAPSTTVPSTTVPSTTVPSTTVPSTTVPSTTVPSTTVPSTPGPSPEPGDGEVVSMVAGVEAEKRVSASWDTGRCFTVRLTNTNPTAVEWEVHLDPGGSIRTLWNAEVTSMGSGDSAHLGSSAGGQGAKLRTTMNSRPRVGEGRLPAKALMLNGEAWNARLAANGTTSFGMCVDV